MKKMLAVLLVLAVMVPMLTFGAFAGYSTFGPSASDLDAVNATCDYPRNSDYLDDYETMTVNSGSPGGAVYCLHGLNDGGKWKELAIRVYDQTEVTVIARHSYKSGGKQYCYACCIFENSRGHMKAGWINCDYLSYPSDYSYAGSNNQGSTNSNTSTYGIPIYSYGPSAEDLDAISATCVYPKSSDYLSVYETMYVSSTSPGGSVYCLHGLNDGGDWKSLAIRVFDQTEVTVIARHSYISGGKQYCYACCIFENSRGHMKAGWINCDYLDY